MVGWCSDPVHTCILLPVNSDLCTSEWLGRCDPVAKSAPSSNAVTGSPALCSTDL